jgi:hypothetical protein
VAIIDPVSRKRVRGYLLAGQEGFYLNLINNYAQGNKLSDEKQGMFTKIIDLARHRSYLLTQLINPGAHKIMPEECNMLSNMR